VTTFLPPKWAKKFHPLLGVIPRPPPLGVDIYFIIKNFLDDSSEKVLILDDSTYDRSRSKKVEFLSRVFDHSTHKYLK